ncbi:hypothetical protein FE257_007615 [Aspergillus nanangensis]|uniref:Uncharacterized protein n=1 Tax=Aspergillus nanangensis TaxID=2582783 RepID=A0AAD4CMF7_ASPNN|nr:hypothetical protein FE257_007615 [Aspergillus nanangensis]
MKRCPVPGPQQKDPQAWVSLLEQYLPPALRRPSEDEQSTPDPTSAKTQDLLAQTLELNNLLFHSRISGDLDLLTHVGFKLNNWPAVYAILGRLLDAADALNEASLSTRNLSPLDWGSSSGLSLDQLTDRCLPAASQPTQDTTPSSSDLTTLDTLTERPFADDHSKRLMAEVWQSLGSIVLQSADVPSNDSKLAMSYVFRLLARLHHSGVVSDRVYKYAPPTSHQVAFRPPVLHLLSTHIMSVISDAAWLVHEAEVAAQAAAAGEDSPYLPFKMGIRELGPEIWLEFILWCCVEHGHIKEGVWLVDQMRRREGDLGWKFESWRPLLQHPGSVWDTKVDLEDSFRRPGHADRSLLRKRGGSAPFNGLGQRTISVEVAASLLDNLPNLVYLGLGFRGVSPAALLRHASSLKFAMTSSTTNETPLPTIKESNWFTVRVVESGGFNPEADPRAFEEILRITPHVVPPWDHDPHIVNEQDLRELKPSHIYDETAALSGLIEYTIRFYASRRLCGDAINAFAWLQSVSDTSKMRRIGEFFSSRMNLDDSERLPILDMGSLASLRPFESSMPQLSPITLAELLDLVTVSRAFVFGEWLLFSTDIDGPAIPPSAYQNQALAPSIIRFAAATKKKALGDAVAQSLSHPLSINTLRSLLNLRVAMGQWDLTVVMLEYLRDYRLKSWGHSNVTALAAEILRIEYTIQHSTTPKGPEAQAQEESLVRAKEILLRILNGEFNELGHRSESNFQQRALCGLQRVFKSIPGALHEVAISADLQYRASPRSAVPYIPITAFHSLLSAVVDTQGSAAGKRLWEQWCLDIKSPTLQRLQQGGIPRLYLHKERNPAKGDPHFDARYFKQVQKKATLPNPNTVRIIAQAAVAEYNEHETQKLQEEKKEEEEEESQPSASPVAPSTPLLTDPFSNPARDILEFCIRKFEGFGLRQSEINREVGGLVYRKKKEMKKKRKLSASLQQ